jgi:hypothetical protein
MTRYLNSKSFIVLCLLIIIIILIILISQYNREDFYFYSCLSGCQETCIDTCASEQVVKDEAIKAAKKLLEDTEHERRAQADTVVDSTET